MKWTQTDAITLARLVEGVAPKHGAHVALTGGLLYKDGLRKDADLLFYRIRQVPQIDRDGLFADLEKLGITVDAHFGFVTKAKWHGRTLDLFFPEQCVSEPEPAPNGRNY